MCARPKYPGLCSKIQVFARFLPKHHVSIVPSTFSRSLDISLLSKFRAPHVRAPPNYIQASMTSLSFFLASSFFLSLPLSQSLSYSLSLSLSLSPSLSPTLSHSLSLSHTLYFSPSFAIPSFHPFILSIFLSFFLSSVQPFFLLSFLPFFHSSFLTFLLPFSHDTHFACL
jgi:hypothetical protein